MNDTAATGPPNLDSEIHPQGSAAELFALWDALDENARAEALAILRRLAGASAEH